MVYFVSYKPANRCCVRVWRFEHPDWHVSLSLYVCLCIFVHIYCICMYIYMVPHKDRKPTFCQHSRGIIISTHFETFGNRGMFWHISEYSLNHRIEDWRLEIACRRIQTNRARHQQRLVDEKSMGSAVVLAAFACCWNLYLCRKFYLTLREPYWFELVCSHLFACFLQGVSRVTFLKSLGSFTSTGTDKKTCGSALGNRELGRRTILQGSLSNHLFAKKYLSMPAAARILCTIWCSCSPWSCQCEPLVLMLLHTLQVNLSVSRNDETMSTQKKSVLFGCLAI